MTPTTQNKNYWDGITEAFSSAGAQGLWRAHSDRVNATLLSDWLDDRHRAQILKTDLFDEAVSPGLFPLLARYADTVHGVDLSQTCTDAAQQRHPELVAQVADIRRLPFTDNCFDCIVSNSTLDHFEESGDINAALAQLHRVLKPGGELVITMDNLQNPLIWLRNSLPYSLLNKVGLVPYFVGHTLSGKGLSTALKRAGFVSIETRSIMHCPRVLAVPTADVLRKHAEMTTQKRYLELLLKFEGMAHWPTAGFSGHFAAARAVKP